MTTTIQFTPTVFRSHWPDVEIPRLPLPEFLLAGAAERADAPAIVEGPTGRVTSYGQLATYVRQVAAGLAAHGLRRATSSRSSPRTCRNGWSPPTGR